MRKDEKKIFLLFALTSSVKYSLFLNQLYFSLTKNAKIPSFPLILASARKHVETIELSNSCCHIVNYYRSFLPVAIAISSVNVKCLATGLL